MAQKLEDSSEIRLNNSTSHNDEDVKALPWKQRLQIRAQSLLKSLRLFIYDAEHQTILGTTSTNWFKISIYYSIFYICLAFFYCGMVAVFGAIISRESPRYDYHNSQMSIEGSIYPGMGFRPMPDITATSITAYADNASQYEMTSSLDSYRQTFLVQTDLTYVDQCSPSQPASSLGTGRSCQLSWTDIVPDQRHPCAPENVYGWAAGQPCVLVKLNQIYGWVPTAGDVTNQVANMTGQPVLSVDKTGANIYITCNGVTAADVGVLGSMMFYSILHPLGNSGYGGIPYYFYPYLNTRENVQPFVLVQFMSLPFDRQVNVECRAWAPNIQQFVQGTQMRGMVQFSIFRSNKTKPAVV